MSEPAHIAVSMHGQIGSLRFCRAERRNAISNQMADEIIGAIARLAADGAKACVLDADGPVFCAGADLGDIKRGDPRIDEVVAAFLESPIFWVAAVRYPVIGAGLGIVAACPVVVAADDVWVSMPEVNLDFFPAGVVAYLEVLMGARSLVSAGLLGNRLSADDAVAHGILTESCVPAEVDVAVQRWTSHAVAHPRTTEGARRVWQSRFATREFKFRKEQLDQIVTEAIAHGRDPD